MMDLFTLPISLPPFDWGTAWWVGVAVAAIAALAITVAIALPMFAIAGGTSLLGTAITIAAISVFVGTLGGVAAGLVKGHQIKLKEEEAVTDLKSQLDVRFVPSAEDSAAAMPYQCELVSYDRSTLEHGRILGAKDIKHISAPTAEVFYEKFESEFRKWLQRVGTNESRNRRVCLFKKPNPGENVIERLTAICNSQDNVTATSKDAEWQSAVHRSRAENGR